jgi:hypothetical protein
LVALADEAAKKMQAEVMNRKVRPISKRRRRKKT